MPAHDELDDDDILDDIQMEQDERDEMYPPDDEEDDDGLSTVASEALKRRRIEASGGKTVTSFGRGKTVATGGANKLTRNGAPKRILAQQKRRDALELRKMGVTYAKIAEAVGYPNASEARKQVLKAYNEIVQEPAAELRTLQVERLNHLLTLAWKEAATGNLSAINTAVAIMARIDVLNGTESAIKIETTTTTNNNIIQVQATEDEFIAQMKRFLNIQPDGSNGPGSPMQVQSGGQAALPAGQVQPPAQTQPTEAQVLYPPGMGPNPTRHETVVVVQEVQSDQAETVPEADITPAPKTMHTNTTGRSSDRQTNARSRFSVKAEDAVDDDK